MREGRRSRILGRRRGAAEAPLPEGHEQIERQELSKLFGRIVAARLIVIPFLLAAVAWLALHDTTSWRRWVLGTAGVTASTFFVVEWLRFRRQGFTPLAIPVNLTVAAVAILTVAFASGGLVSPFMVILLPFAMLSGLVTTRPLHVVVPGVELAGIWTLWAIATYAPPPDFHPAVFASQTGAVHVTGVALLYTFVIVVITGVTRLTRGTLQRTIGRTIVAQRESLKAHAERAEELTALSAEIAHELKNPLASVKGLAALLARDAAPGGKEAERLGVLRREVDRMQSVLDGFLNFSRPLVPLALGEADVGALAREVAALHEGMAKERDLEVTAAAGAVQVRCDPRKVKQVLINLVQNAFDASPRGEEVQLEAAALPDGGARVRVLDRGRGVDPALGETIFQPGVTTKSTGSGLGLTIARALARQHGGDLQLLPRAGGGTVAELSLPGASSAPAAREEGCAA